MCTDQCTVSPTFTHAQGINVALLPMHKRPFLRAQACLVCDEPATIKCLKCHIRVYCSSKCFLNDFDRHELECSMHCPRLQLFQDFEKYFAPTVRIKHTGYKPLGFGMFARRAISPGERVLEDAIHGMAQYISQDVVIGDLENTMHLDKYVRIVDIDGTFVRNAASIMFATHGYQGFWSSFINHSCIPNCILDISECRKYILVTAIRPILAGSQIYIAYAGAAHAPLAIRAPILEKILSGPCLCNTCVFPKPNIEIGRKTVWNVVQHANKCCTYKLLDISANELTPEIIRAIADRIIVLARAVLGFSDQYADPWLAVVLYTVTLYIKAGIKKTRSKMLKQYLVKIERDASNAAKWLGFCVQPLRKK